MDAEVHVYDGNRTGAGKCDHDENSNRSVAERSKEQDQRHMRYRK